MGKYANVKTIETNICKFAHLQICRLISTGTRIRTQIKGVGDPYASRCTMPARKELPLNPLKGTFEVCNYLKNI